jgi:two-component system chemotaxis sensor kinase CheA
MNESDEVLKEFLVESLELLDKVEHDLVALEKGASKETVASIFRGFHTIKGTCGFLGLARLESVTHAGENLLGKVRDGKLQVSPPIVTALLATADAARKMLHAVESSGKDGSEDHQELLATLAQLQQGAACAARPANAATAAPQAVQCAAPAVASEPAARETRAPSSGAEEASSLASGKIRVDVGLLEKLMNLVGELVLTRNQLLQFTAAFEDAAFLATSQRLNLITTELQEGVMKARMQPIDNVWSKFPRVVRDLAVTCGKRVRIEMEGRDTELDRTIIEAIKDPLTHIVRNAVDHGIERPEKRSAAGKNPEGLLFLRAFHEGGQVNIEITDDGAGIDLARVKQKALERALLTAEQVAQLSDREALSLIFLPGFSTAEKVTNVSGRGVGMDVVKTNVEKIGGTVELQSKAGEGSTLAIKIPLTLAIIPALVVSSGGDQYAIPQVSLLELLRLEGEEAHASIERIHGAPVYRLRGNLLPLVYLHQELQVDAARGRDEGTNIVVLQAGEKRFGLVVDEVNDTEEIVVKPLGKQLKGIGAFAGATIMGDGRVALILDVLGLAQRAHVIAGVRGRAHALEAAEGEKAAGGESHARQTLLLFRGPDDARMVIPLARVARLEEFPAAAVEQSGGSPAVQYRGEILPLILLSSVLVERRRARRNPKAMASAQAETIQVVVFSVAGRQVGLVVDQILDILEAEVVLKRKATRPGVLGSMVIQGRITELLDLEGIVAASEPAPRKASVAQEARV